MLFLFTGIDRETARREMNKVVAQEGKKKHITRITDANSVSDLQESLRGSGMFAPLEASRERLLNTGFRPLTGFGEERVIVLDGVLANEDMRSVVLDALPHMKASDETFYILEEKPDAEMRRTLEKHAETVEKFDVKKEKKGSEIFALAHALRRGDKKALWVGYQRALAREEAPEAIHGVLFWGAKDMLLRSKAGSPEHRRGAALVAELAELPHEARRQGFELEYALEHYILGLPR